MINANELRIGNYVNTKNGIKRITQLSIDGKSQSDECNPIELSEELLLKNGYKKVGINFESDKIILHKNIKTGTLDFLLHEPSSGKLIKKPVLYVHKLQNLHYEITDQELIINL